MTTPFEIGDTYYLPHYSGRQITVPCSVCYGKLAVTLILGNGDHIWVACEGCGLGQDGPQGYTKEWTYTPLVTKFTIQGIHSMRGNKWTVISTDGQTAEFEFLKRTEQDAMEMAIFSMNQLIEQNMKHASARTKVQREKLCWTVRYHEECIKKYEKHIAWHRTKIGARVQTKGQPT